MKEKTCVDDELQKFSDILADEMVMLFNTKIPPGITCGKTVYFTSIMIHREHFPDGYINFNCFPNNCFPVLVCPEKTEASIILPSRYWATESQKKKSGKPFRPLRNEELTKLLDQDPVKFVEVIQEHINDAYTRCNTSKSAAERWSERISFYRYQKSTGLIYCGRHVEAENLLGELLDGMNANKAQESGNRFYIIILSNLITTLIELGKYEEAGRNIAIIERTISNMKDTMQTAQMEEVVRWKRLDLYLSKGDLEKARPVLESLLDSSDTKTGTGNLLMYQGIYFYKKGEKEKALDFFNKVSEVAKTPYTLMKADYYKRMLLYMEPVYNDNPDDVSKLEAELGVLREILIDGESEGNIEFHTGATIEDIEEAEALTGVKLNNQLKAFFQSYNGCSAFIQGRIQLEEGRELSHFRFLKLEDAVVEWERYKPYELYQYQRWSFKEKMDPRINPFLHHRYWFPIAKGDSICIYFDSDPQSKGNCGQIVGYSHYPPSIFFVSDSLVGFLEKSNQNLVDGPV